MIEFEKLTHNQRARAALHRDIFSLCQETCHSLGLEITRPATVIVAELVLKKLSAYGSDLEAFAKHAKRSVINTEDVKLLARRNNSLKEHLMAISKPTPVKRRKTTVPLLTDTSHIKTDSTTDNTKKDIDNKEVKVKKAKIVEEEQIKTAKIFEDLPGPSKPPEKMIEDTIDLTDL